jgi:hypothetical protein
LDIALSLIRPFTRGLKFKTWKEDIPLIKAFTISPCRRETI